MLSLRNILRAALFAPILLIFPPGRFAPDGTATVAAAPVERFAPLPPLPDSIPSQLGWVHVTRTPKPLCGEKPVVSEVFILGCFNHETRELDISTALSLAQAWQTLEHERFHMILWDSGLRLDPAGEEALADVIGSARVLEMVTR